MLDQPEWYPLFMQKNDGTFARYREEVGPDGGIGTRDELNLHPGTASEGCVTVEKESDCWKPLNRIINMGVLYRRHHDPEFESYGFNGYLYVRNQ